MIRSIIVRLPRIQDSRIGISAHAACIRPLVSIEQPLVILCGTNGRPGLPLVMPIKLTSSPSRNSSITRIGPKLLDRIAGLLLVFCAMTTPFPAARPSALITTGKEKCLRAVSASSKFVHCTALAVGMPALLKNCFAKIFEPSKRAAAWVGPTIFSLRVLKLVDYSCH